jgi:site-specific recombinase XerD
MSLLEAKPYRLFLNSLKSPESRKSYSIYIKKYMELQKITNLLADPNPKLIEEQIITFIIKMTENGKRYSSLHNYVTAVLSFYKMNDVVLNTSKISKFMPEQTRIKKDRAYTHEEIGKLLEIADERTRVIILLMASTGMRIGALPELRLRNLERMHEVYKITIYENYNQEYFTFCSYECVRAIDSYLNFRKRYGEKLSPE